MSFVEAVWLGVVQGLTEFLPVSSSGHLVLAQAWLGVATGGIVFEVAVHAATLLAVVVFYRGRLLELVRGAFLGRPDAWTYAGKLALGTVPAGAAGLLGRAFFEAQFERPAVASVCLIVTGLLLWTTRRTLAWARAEEPSWWAAWWIGCAQAFAIFPGISRSGATVVTALALGVAPVGAAAFSFLLSIPAILGAVVLELPDLAASDPDARLAIAAGSAAALASGLVALALFVRLLRGGHFHRFAYYVWALGIVTLVL